MTPLIQAKLARKDFAVGESVPFTLSVANPSATELLAVADPRRGGDSLRFTVGFPNGQELSFTTGEALQAPGVKQIPIDMRVPPNVRQDFEFDLTEWIRFEKPGSYRLKVGYEWKKGEPPWSSEVTFVINSPTGSFLEAVPAEAARMGYYGLLWSEADDNQGRVLLADYRIERPLLDVRRAREIAKLPMGAAPSLSMSPAGLPFSERWLAWVVKDQLHTVYHADTLENKLPLSTTPLPGPEFKLVSPPLSEAAPDEGRPGCMIALVTPGSASAGTLLPVEINRRGQARMLSAPPLPGAVLDAWATSTATSNPTFILAVRVGNSLELLAVTCPWKSTGGTSKSLLSIEGELLGGDVRATLDEHLQIGLVVKRGATRERLSFTITLPGAKVEPITSPLFTDEDTTVVRARLDERAQLHLLLRNRQRLSYVPPDANAEVWSDSRPAESGKSFDLLLRPGFPAALVYYDTTHGPISVGL